MKERAIKKRAERIVRRVVKYWNTFDQVGKREFEHGIDLIIEGIADDTQLPPGVIGQHTQQILQEFAQEYPNVPDELKGYEAMISMFYFKYMQHLGLLTMKTG